MNYRNIINDINNLLNILNNTNIPNNYDNYDDYEEMTNLGEEIGSVNININIDQISKNYEKEIECPICFDTTTDNKITHCNHTFCKKCLENWIINYNKCPICMLELKKIN